MARKWLRDDSLPSTAESFRRFARAIHAAALSTVQSDSPQGAKDQPRATVNEAPEMLDAHKKTA